MKSNPSLMCWWQHCFVSIISHVADLWAKTDDVWLLESCFYYFFLPWTVPYIPYRYETVAGKGLRWLKVSLCREKQYCLAGQKWNVVPVRIFEICDILECPVVTSPNCTNAVHVFTDVCSKTAKKRCSFRQTFYVVTIGWWHLLSQTVLTL